MARLAAPGRLPHAAAVSGRVTRRLSRASPVLVSAYAITAAFTAYFCMYAFRKPFTAAAYEGESVGGVELKIALVLGQVLGYAASKFLSIKLVTELHPARRARVLVALIVVAELALLAFAIAPPAGKVVALFCNGLPLGAVWGLVFGFLEGRRTSEILGAGMSASYIVASGGVKSVGRLLLDGGVSESWMPFVTGLLFLVPFLVAVAALRRLPPPDAEDVQERVARRPMDAAERRRFFARFATGLVALTALYMLLTAYRDFRDNFAVELWSELGWADQPSVLTFTEIPVALCVLVGLALLYRIHDNRRAFFAVHALMAAGTILVGLATLAFDMGLLGPVGWMIAIGVGLYLAYVPYGSMLFDRLIAYTGTVGTAVFMIYVTDAFGYAGSIGVMLYKNFGEAELSWLAFFRAFSYATAIACTSAFALSAWYFARRAPSPGAEHNR